MTDIQLAHVTRLALATLVCSTRANPERSGTKPDLQAALFSVLDSPPSTPPKSLRITSIDMGVRNLSVCQVLLERVKETGEQVVPKVEEKTKKSKKAESETKTDATETNQVFTVSSSASASSATIETWSTRDISEFSKSPGATEDNIPWDLRNDSLLEVAYNFVSRELLGSHVTTEPAVILLERQRHRSQGSPSVLEWVFRVNMFESILAGSIYTYKEVSRERNDKSPDSTQLYRVDPRMVSDYFIRGKRAKGAKFDIKAEKIGAVGQWLESASRDIPGFEVAEEVEEKPKKKTRKKKVVEDESDEVEPAEVKKSTSATSREKIHTFQSIPGFSNLSPQLHGLSAHYDVMASILAKKRTNSVKSKKADDVADSFLQALAWYNWQYNREYLRELLQNEDDDRWTEVNQWVKENVE